MTTQNINRILGRIEGKLEGVDCGIKELKKNINTIEKRLQDVEQRSIKNGTIAGALMGVSTGILANIIKTKIG